MNETIQIIILVNGCRRNDRNSQRMLYHSLYGYAMKICYRYASNYQEAGDLTNESFVRLFKTIHQINSGRQLYTGILFKAWFKKIIINTCIDSLRKNYPIVSNCSLVENDEPAAVMGETDIDKLSHGGIIEAIKQLTPVYRTVFNLFVIEGMSHEEIAGKLNICVDVSESKLSKARYHLRKIILHRTLYKNNLQTK